MSSQVTPPARPGITPRTVWNWIKTPLTLLALLALCWYAFQWGWKAFNTPIPPPPPTPCQSVQLTSVTPPLVQVNVFNGSTERRRANGVAGNLRSVGFNVETVGNTSERITQTVIRGHSADAPEMALVAGFFSNPRIEPDGRVDHTVDVLVGPRDADQQGNEWAGMVKEAPTQVAVPAGVACLPATPSPSAVPSPRTARPTPAPTPTATRS